MLLKDSLHFIKRGMNYIRSLCQSGEAVLKRLDLNLIFHSLLQTGILLVGHFMSKDKFVINHGAH